MNIISGVGDFFGLDIGAASVRIVQLQGGHGGLKVLVKYAYTALDPKITMSDSHADQQKTAQAIAKLINDAKISTNNVAVGLPSHKVFSTVVDIDRLSPQELAKTIHYQAESFIPTTAAESKIDWAVLGDSPTDKSKVEVFITSVTNSFTETRLDMLESIGLNVIAFEPDSVAMLRALIPPGLAEAVLVLDIGSHSTDLAISMNDSPRLTRSIPTGSASIIHGAAQNLNITDEQAAQFVFKFGLSKDKLEGQVYGAIIGAVDLLTGEIEKSINFFNERYNNVKIGRIIVTGSASSLPEFPLYIANKFNTNIEIGNAWRNVAFPADRQNELLAVSNYFSVAVGLAERNE